MIRCQVVHWPARTISLHSFREKAEACAFAVEQIHRDAESVFLYDSNGFGVFGTKDPDAWNETIYSGMRP